jgi:predicted dehydrogenase
VTDGGEHRVALVGCGYVARVHLSALARIPRARVVALCDPVRERAEALAPRTPGAAVHTDLREMLASVRPDVVHVLTPVADHAATAVAALGAAAHVLVEKPLATDATAARTILAAARDARRQVGVDHNRLFDPVMDRARALVARGAVGRVVGAEVFQGFERGAPGGPDGDPSHWVHRLPGGILHNLAPHPAYLLEAFIGPARRVEVLHARSGVVSGSPVEEVRAVVEGERAVGSLTLSLAARPFMATLAVYGSEASLSLNFSTQTLVVRRPPRGPKLVAKAWENLSVSAQLFTETARTAVDVARRRYPLYPGMHALVRDFYGALAAGAPLPVSGADGLRNVELLDDLWAAAAEAAPAYRSEARA